MSVNAETTQDRTATFLLEGNETRRVRGTNTGPTVLDRLAGGEGQRLRFRTRNRENVL